MDNKLAQLAPKIFLAVGMIPLKDRDATEREIERVRKYATYKSIVQAIEQLVDDYMENKVSQDGGFLDFLKARLVSQAQTVQNQRFTKGNPPNKGGKAQSQSVVSCGGKKGQGKLTHFPGGFHASL